MPKGYSNKDGKPLINPQARKGKVPWNKDKKLPPLSKKWKDNIGKANKGHLVSKGKRIKIGNKHRGKIAEDRCMSLNTIIGDKVERTGYGSDFKITKNHSTFS